MDDLRLFLGVMIIMIGVFLGLYVGFWVCFVGGIWDIVQMVQEDAATKLGVFWAVLKIVFAAFFGWMTAFICFGIAKVVGGLY